MEPQTTPMPSIPGPVGLSSWLAMNSENLKPPVNNMCLYSGKDFILMAVGGPNTRNDYHSKSTEKDVPNVPKSMLMMLNQVNETEVTIQKSS
jgi:3-hydroxyanthranilate 3,4-dioxygenase